MMLDRKELMVHAQIIILLLSISAFGYFASESSGLKEGQAIIITKNNAENDSGIFLGFLKLFNNIFFSERGFVSAEETVSTCVVTKEGKICQTYPTSECNENCAQSCIMGTTETVTECKLGTCYDSIEGKCNLGAPKAECESNGGTWFNDRSGNIIQCKRGCCTLLGQTQFITERACERSSTLLGAEKQFTFDIKTEAACLAVPALKEEGACLLGAADAVGKRECKFTKKENCNTMKGEFYTGMLCSNPELKTKCERQKTTNCVEGRDEIYWFDSCGNRENIYDANKVRSWNDGKVLSKEESCSLGSSTNTLSAQRTCGNCNYILGSTCGNKTATQKLDDSTQKYVCKDLSCVDSEGKKREHGESWCVYQGSIGVEPSKSRAVDTPGSSHFMRMCVNGEIITTPCEIGRKQICAQGEVDRGDKIVSKAACTTNTALECMSYNSNRNTGSTDKVKDKCNANPDCFFKTVDVDKYFKFSYCTSKYPVMGGESCSAGTQKCTIYYKKKFSGSWSCEENCDCKHGEFAEKMNDLCMSLSDCGAEVNYMGGFSSNYKVSGSKALSSNYITNLKKYASEVPRQVVPAAGRVNFSGAGTIIDGEVNNGDTSRDMTLAVASTVVGAYSGLLVGMAAYVIYITATAAAFGPIGWVVAIVVAIIFAVLTYGFGVGKIKKKKAKFTCQSWEPPSGGEDCEKCGSDGLPCSEYACWSLGTMCKLINKDTGEEKCVFDNTRDVVPPQITPNQELLGTDYNYTSIGDPRLGTEVRTAAGGCIPAYSVLNVGILLDKLGKCSYSTLPSSPIDEDEFGEEWLDELSDDEIDKYYLEGDFGDSRYRTNHSMMLPMPDFELIGGSGLRPNATAAFDIYVTCRNMQGKSNAGEYKMSFCITPQRDITPPRIAKVSKPYNGYVKNNANEQEVIFYMNEPSECRWGERGKSYDNMANNFTCDTNFDEQSIYPGGVGWLCGATMPIRGNLTTHYILCKDRPWDENESARNIMQEPYNLTLRETAPLEIVSAKPDGEKMTFGVEPATVEIEVETSGGVNDVAYCSYSFDNVSHAFYNTGGDYHSHQFDQIISGEYNVRIACIDDAENEAAIDISFSAELDSDQPKITRVYQSAGNLVIITDEKAECAISPFSCAFDFKNATQMTGGDKYHSIPIALKTNYYVTCKDKFGNTKGECDLRIKAL